MIQINPFSLACIWLLLTSASSIANAQNPHNLILNGDFEVNSAPNEISNASNTLFNFRMDAVRAYGEREGIDIQTVGGPITDNPQSGDWNIAMTADQNGDSEEISFQLASHLDRNEPYHLEFYMRRMISLSHDGGRIKIGISNNMDSFGTLVFTSSETSSISWQQQRITFVAPFNAKYLTVKVDNAENNWVGLDNFSLCQAQGELLLNGNFESNDVEEFVEQYDLPHVEFDSLMQNVASIGGGDGGLDILTVSGPIDSDESIAFWMVAGGGAVSTKAPVEALSMTMIEPVQAGNLYYLEFNLQRGIIPGDIDGSGGSVVAGISLFGDQTGVEIYQSPVATMGWTRLGTTFTAPLSGSYLTIEFLDAADHWLIVDNFSLRPFLLGDVNFDDQIDLLDVAPFVELLTNGTFLAEADVNQDGALDLLDVMPFVELLVGN